MLSIKTTAPRLRASTVTAKECARGAFISLEYPEFHRSGSRNLGFVSWIARILALPGLGGSRKKRPRLHVFLPHKREKEPQVWAAGFVLFHDEVGHLSSIRSRMNLAKSIARSTAVNFAGLGLVDSSSFSLRAARIVAANKIAYFLRSVIGGSARICGRGERGNYTSGSAVGNTPDCRVT